MRLDDLDFSLPEELIAQHPSAGRDDCRLLHLRRRANSFDEHRFAQLADLLRPGDTLVRNVTRVIPARLLAVKEVTGARCELLLVEPGPAGTWWALVRPARRLPLAARLRLEDETPVVVVEVGDGGRRRLGFPDGVDALECARRHGSLPLPPYIRRAAGAADTQSYQTVYARVDGSVAAPTAGLHFTPRLFATLRARGVEWLDVVLHIGPGTFEPVRSADPREHVMHWERFEVDASVVESLHRKRQAGHRVVAIGTTATRVVESIAAWEADANDAAVELTADGHTLHGRTRLFIYPPYAWQCVDALLTNFHLPRSTLLMLVDAFAGRDLVRAAYAWAIAHRFRFFSYGDAMLIE